MAKRSGLAVAVLPLCLRNPSDICQNSTYSFLRKSSKERWTTSWTLCSADWTFWDRLKLLFRKKNRPARRFEAARFIADHLCAERRDRWLPVSDAATARQKVQRAFAAEFLCPIASLRNYLGDEFLPE